MMISSKLQLRLILVITLWFTQVCIPSCTRCKSTIWFAPGIHCNVSISPVSIHAPFDTSTFTFDSNELRLNVLVNLRLEEAGICSQNSPSFSIFSSQLMACAESSIEIGSLKDSIVKVELIDLLGYTDTLQDEDISNITEFRIPFTVNDSNWFTLDYLKTKNFNNRASHRDGYYELRIMKLPKTEKHHQFKIIVHLNTGRKIEAISNKLLIKT